MKIIVLKRFSVRDKETKKLKFYEVNQNAIEIDENLGQNAVALGLAKTASINK